MHTKSEVNDYKVIVFRDSFFLVISYYFAESFEETQMFWKRYGTQAYYTIYEQQEHIVETKSDIVIEESVERLMDRILLNGGKLKEVE